MAAAPADPWLVTNHPMMNPEPPDRYTWSLGLRYLVWAMVIVIRYFACRWFAGIKRTRKDRWLAFL